VRRLRRGGVTLAVFDRDAEVARALATEAGAQAARSVRDLVSQLSSPRIVWLMLPAGAITQQTIDDIAPLLAAGDIIVDGANGYYKDAITRQQALFSLGVHLVDAGVSGGVWGLENGYGLMLGGDPAAIRQVEPLLKRLAPSPDQGWLHCGPVGSGHFVKMIHNGIEYGMMQAYAEGLALLKGKQEFDLDLAAVTEMWRHGSVVRSWLLDLTAEFLKNDQRLENIAPFVADSGEGRWTAMESIEQGIPTPVMSTALMMRFATQGANDYAARLLAMMRKSFGGHATQSGPKP
jgi:6-phosphogluconate dehydrogenase